MISTLFYRGMLHKGYSKREIKAIIKKLNLKGLEYEKRN